MQHANTNYADEPAQPLSQPPDPWAPVTRACRKAKIRLSELARRVGVKRQSVNSWKRRSRREGKLFVPAERVLDVERALTPHLPKERIRPDLYRRTRARRG